MLVITAEPRWFPLAELEVYGVNLEIDVNGIAQKAHERLGVFHGLADLRYNRRVKQTVNAHFHHTDEILSLQVFNEPMHDGTLRFSSFYSNALLES